MLTAEKIWKSILFIVLIVLSFALWFHQWRDGYYIIEYDNWEKSWKLSKAEVIYLLDSHPNMDEAFTEMRQKQIDIITSTPIATTTDDDDCPYRGKLALIHCR